MARPGGQKSLTAGLDIVVQMQGISGAIAEFTGLTKKANAFNTGVIDFGTSSKTSSEMVLGGFRNQAVYLEKAYTHWVEINKERFKELDALKEARTKGELPADKKERLKQLEEELTFRRDMVPEMRNITKETDRFGQALDIVGAVGGTAFSLLKDGISEVKDIEDDTKAGLDILTESFMSTVGLFKKLWDLGADDPSGVDKIQEAISGASNDLVIDELKVTTLKFEEAVGPEVSKAGDPKKALEGAKDEKTGVEEVKKKLAGDAKKGKGKDPISADQMNRFKKAAKSVREGSKGVSADTAKAAEGIKGAGEASKFATAAKGRLANIMTKVGKFARSAGAAIKAFGGFLAGLGPVGIIVAAALVVVAAGLLAVAVAARFMIRGFKIAIKDMETLRHVNYRALGSIHELTAASYDVGMATGLSTAQTMESIKAMSKAGITADELSSRFGDSGKAMRDLAIMQGQFTRMTDVSADTVAKLQKRLMAGGSSMAQMQRTLDRTSMTMRKFGITGKDADALMGTLTKSLMNMSAIYKGKELDAYVDAMTGLAAAAKRAGVSMAVVAQIDKDLRQLKGGATTLMVLGGALDQLMTKGAAAGSMDNLVSGYEKALQITKALPKGVQDVALANMGVSDEMRAMLDTEKKRRDELKKNFMLQGMTSREARRAMKEQLKLEADQKALRLKADEDYRNSISTLTQQMQQMFAPIQAKAAKAMMPLIEGITAFIGRVGPIFIEVIGSAMDWLMALGQRVAMMFMWVVPVIELVGSVLGWVVSLLFKLGTIAQKAITLTLWPLYALYVALKTIIKPILWLGKVIYDVFAWILDGISWVYDKLIALQHFVIDVLAPAFALLLAPLYPVLGVVAAIGVALWLVKEYLMLLWDFWSWVFGGIYDITASVFGGIYDAVASVFGAIWDVIKEPFLAIGEFLGELWGLVSAIFGAIGTFISDVFGSIWDAISPVFSWLYEAFMTLWPVIKVLGAILLAVFAPILIPIMMVVAALKIVAGVFKWLTGLVKSLKKWLFGSSFLHIAEGIGFIMPFFDLLSNAISFLLTPIKMIGAAFGWLWDMGKAAFGGLIDIVTAPFRAMKAGFDWVVGMGEAAFDGLTSIVTAPFRAMGAVASGVMSAVSAPFKALGNVVGGVWDWLTGDDDEAKKEEKKAVKQVDDMSGSMMDAYVAVMSSMPGPLGAAGKVIGNAVSSAWDWLTGGGEEEKATKSIQDMGISMEDAYKVMESPLSSAIDSIGSAVSDAWNWLTGGDEKKAGTADIKKQMAEASASGVSKAASAPMYTSKFDDDTKKSKGERESELVRLQQETVALLAKILEKNDPENERAADALESLANNANESENTSIFRSREGFGEHVVHWWNSK
jgi:phage-related protein